jgi:hypothetical protein
MRKILAALLFLVAAPCLAQRATYDGPLIVQYDLDGAAADNDVIVASAALADSTTYVIASQPDAPRPLVVGITDADSSISAGTLTIAGTNTAGATITHVVTFASGGTTTSTSTVYFKTVTSVITSALTGEGAGDAVIVGTTSTIPEVFCSYLGQRSQVFGQPFPGYALIATSGSSTTVSSYATSSSAFYGVSVGDLLFVMLDGIPTERVVTAVTSVDEITIDTAISTTKTSYAFRKRYCGTESAASWVNTENWWNTKVAVDVAQMDATGGVIATVYCADDSTWMSPVTVWSKTYATAGTDTVDIASQFNRCRVGLKIGTNDDASDTTTHKEIINVYFREGEPK